MTKIIAKQADSNLTEAEAIRQAKDGDAACLRIQRDPRAHWDRRLLEEWMPNWSDLIDFEVHAVVTSKVAAEKIASRL